MAATGRVQPAIAGTDMKHVTAPPDPNAYSAAQKGSLLVEFGIIEAQTTPGGKTGWLIVFGSNSTEAADRDPNVGAVVTHYDFTTAGELNAALDHLVNLMSPMLV